MALRYRDLAEFLSAGLTGHYQCVKGITLGALEWEDLRAYLCQLPKNEVMVSDPEDPQPHFIMHGVKIYRSGEL